MNREKKNFAVILLVLAAAVTGAAFMLKGTNFFASKGASTDAPSETPMETAAVDTSGTSVTTPDSPSQSVIYDSGICLENRLPLYKSLEGLESKTETEKLPIECGAGNFVRSVTEPKPNIYHFEIYRSEVKYVGFADGTKILAFQNGSPVSAYVYGTAPLDEVLVDAVSAALDPVKVALLNSEEFWKRVNEKTTPETGDGSQVPPETAQLRLQQFQMRSGTSGGAATSEPVATPPTDSSPGH
jgi:hypothetical protein